MYKLIALDMDGTLLTSDKTISHRTQQAIAQARKQGVKVVLASGRPLDGMQAKINELDITGENEFVVYFNGSMVKEIGSGKLLHSAIISGRDAKRVANLAREFGGYCHAFSTELGLITPKLNEFTDIEANINQIPVTVKDFDELEDAHPIIKVMIVADPDTLTRISQTLPVQYREEFTVVQSAPIFLEFLNKESNKGVGVKAIADHMGICAENVICMGDAENDHHMIEYAGLGVAMENAMEETKAIADHITLSNNDDGVAAVIEAFVLAR
ncbi:HAD family hydrolase [Vibrio xuii]|nr:HAD family hydrolase [Vibrio xuii]